MDQVRAEQWLVDYARVEGAIRWLDANAASQPDLARLAAAMHLSPAHLQRTFTRFAGTSPKRLLRWLTADAARRLLRDRHTVLDTTAEVGLSSAGRLHDLVVAVDAVTPGSHAARGEGLRIAVGVHPTPIGRAVVGLTDRGVCALRFLDAEAGAPPTAVDDHSPVARARADLAADWPRAVLLDDGGRADSATGEVAERVGAALEGAADGDRSARPPLPTLLRGTNLQLKVWEALLRLPEDRVTSYGRLAAAAGRPDAVRAVASAVGRNPVAPLVPCHRVLRSTGALGGYRWGETRKRALLAREAARADGRIEGDLPADGRPTGPRQPANRAERTISRASG